MSSSIPTCQLTCLNGGYCEYISSDEFTLFDIFARGGLIQNCICLPGYTGISCESKVEQCSVDMKCHNGVPCALNEKTGQQYCDCSVADAISTFAGKMCREPATSYCGQGDIKNRSFCTNGGICQSNIYPIANLNGASNEYSIHKGCACPPEFEGDHCEFLIVVPLHDSKQVQSEESAQPSNLDDVEVATNRFSFLAPSPPINEQENSSSLSSFHLKESTESKSRDTNHDVQLVAPATHHQPVNDGDAPIDAPIDLESASKATTPSAIVMFGNRGSAPEVKVGGIITVVLSITGVVLLIGLFAHRRLKRRRKIEPFFVLGDNYKDDTPIRVKERSELELDDLNMVLGWNGNSAEYEDEEDIKSVTERSECSLEEIELDYPTNVNNDEDDLDNVHIHNSNRNPFEHIIGPLIGSRRNEMV